MTDGEMSGDEATMYHFLTGFIEGCRANGMTDEEICRVLASLHEGVSRNEL